MWRRGRTSFWNLWFLSITAGIVAGTIWANLPGRELLSQIGYFDGIYKAGQLVDEAERRLLWRYVLGQRLWETGLGGLLAMTPLAIPGYLVLSFGAGFVLAVIISIFTIEKGIAGIVVWLATVFPQGLCYLGIWAVWLVSVRERQELNRVRIWVLVGFLAVAGSFLEVWVSPVFLGLV